MNTCSTSVRTAGQSYKNICVDILHHTFYNEDPEHLYLLSYRHDGEKGYFMVCDVYAMRVGMSYYDKFHLRGSEEKFDRLEAKLARYAKLGLIDSYYIFELSPEDEEDAKDD